MGFLDSKAKDARNRQKQALFNEAQKAGSQIVQVVDLADDAQAGAAALGSSLKMFTGGRLAVDSVQFLVLDAQGFRHLYAQPYSGLSPLPGEHHTILPGVLPSPAVLRAGGFLSGPKWDTGAMAGLAKSLGADGAMRVATNGLAWDWKAGMGEIELSWTIQLRSLGNGHTHLVLQAGRYGGFTTYEVGFAPFLKVASAVHTFLSQADVPEQQFLEGCAFGSALSLLTGEAPMAEPDPVPVAGGAADAEGAGPEPDPARPAATPAPAVDSVVVSIDYRDVVRGALTPHVGKRVHIEGFPAKKEANVRKHVLPPENAQDTILAIVDLTTFGSAKDAIVITRSHLFAKDIDDRLAFPLADVETVVGQAGFANAVVETGVARLGTVGVPVGMAEEAVLALMQSLAEHNGGGAVKAQVHGFVTDAPGEGLSLEAAQAVQAQVQAAMGSDVVSDKINAAARLMTSGQFQACIEAYQQIAIEHPEELGTCHANIGAAYYFLGDYRTAIAHYTTAKAHGADAAMMDDNIVEAQQALAKSA